MNFKVLISVTFAAVISVAGCSDDETTGGSGGSAGGGGEGGGGMVEADCDNLPDLTGYAVEGAPPTDTEDCTGDVFMPTANSAADLNARLNNADPGDVICLAEDTYNMSATIKISLVSGLTLKGIGDSPDDTVLVFGGPGSGPGIEASKDDVTIENLWVKNTGANGIEQSGTSGSVFRKVHVSWDNPCKGDSPPANCDATCNPKLCDDASDNAGVPCRIDMDCPNGACVEQENPCDDELLTCVVDSLTATEGVCLYDKGINGAYGIYPTNCQDTKVEYSQASNASDAGIYVGKCGWEDDTTEGGVVHHNIVNGNVAGLEVENCLGVTVYENFVIDNTGGLMPLSQPGAASETRPSNTDVLMENNRVWCNNHWNFAKVGVVEIIPAGSGFLMLGGDGIEVRNNDIQGNDTGGMLIVSNALTCAAAGADCPPFDFPEYNPYVENVYVHNNVFVDNGTNADQTSSFYLIFDILNMGTPENPTPNIVWDGFVAEGVADPKICLGEDYTGTYIDLTDNMCGDVASAPEFAGCIGDSKTTSTEGRLCSPSSI
jgi:parallel beta-helix repeat protein